MPSLKSGHQDLHMTSLKCMHAVMLWSLIHRGWTVQLSPLAQIQLRGELAGALQGSCVPPTRGFDPRIPRGILVIFSLTRMYPKSYKYIASRHENVTLILYSILPTFEHSEIGVNCERTLSLRCCVIGIGDP